MLRRDIKLIKDNGKKVYAVINPGTPLCLESLVDEIDGVLMMSVNPGFAKQKFIPSVLTKIQELIKGGADVNVKNKDGESALSMAKKRGRKEIVELLKKAGAKE